MSKIGLRDYQKSAIERMQNGCILCGGVGSGKSRTALGYYYVQNGGDIDSDEYVPMDDNDVKDLYVITTLSPPRHICWRRTLQKRRAALISWFPACWSWRNE